MLFLDLKIALVNVYMSSSKADEIMLNTEVFF